MFHFTRNHSNGKASLLQPKAFNLKRNVVVQVVVERAAAG